MEECLQTWNGFFEKNLDATLFDIYNRLVACIEALRDFMTEKNMSVYSMERQCCYVSDAKPPQLLLEIARHLEDGMPTDWIIYCIGPVKRLQQASGEN